jgi:outer membrane protein OmpA-like peptidoglycan-associated protein
MLKKIIKSVVSLLCFLIVITLAGCSSCQEQNFCSQGGNNSNCYDTVDCPPRNGNGCLFGYDYTKVPTTCDEKRQDYLCKLQEKGVKLIEIGDNVTFVLPSDRFFIERTPMLDGDYFYTLNLVALYLCCLDKINVKVAAYTDCTSDPLRNLALSRAQAKAVLNYLWRRGVDARVMYAVGYGGLNSIATNYNCCGQSQNRRVEISFRRITDSYDY